MGKILTKNYKNEGGITLIALIVTIIILLILASVSIAMLTGENGILTQAKKAEKLTEISSEKEVIQIVTASDEMDKLQGDVPKYNIGKPLYDKNFDNSNIWNMIIINETQEKYGTGCRYIEKGTEIEGYGKTKYNWIIDKNGEIIQLEEGSYAELSYGDDLATTDGLVFNMDSNNIDNSDLTTWGEGVSLHGFENNTPIESDGLEFDGVDDYVEFKSTADYSKGFTLSFYGISYSGKHFFAKQKENDVSYSCRFSLGRNDFTFNTSKNIANSKWSSNTENDNGILKIPCLYTLGEIAYFDLIFDANTNEFKLYKNNEFIDSDIVEEGYWHGENGGRQVLEDDTISCYLARAYGGVGGGISQTDWFYSKVTIYSLRLYNRPLNESELKSNYDKTIAMHSINE